MKKIVLFFIFINYSMQAQIGINSQTVHPSAKLHLESQNKGLLLPRLDSLQVKAIANPAEGLLVFNTVFNSLDWFNGIQWINAYTKPQSPEINSTIPYTNQVEVFLHPTLVHSSRVMKYTYNREIW